MGGAVPAVREWRKEENLTVDEWCAISRTSRFHAYRMIKAKKIPAFQNGEAYRIPVRWARAQLGEIEDETYTRLEAEKPGEPEAERRVGPPKRGRPRREAA